MATVNSAEKNRIKSTQMDTRYVCQGAHGRLIFCLFLSGLRLSLCNGFLHIDFHILFTIAVVSVCYAIDTTNSWFTLYLRSHFYLPFVFACVCLFLTPAFWSLLPFQRVGCDLKIGSTKKIDGCGVCGGDGNSCSQPLYYWEMAPMSQCSATCGGGKLTPLLTLKIIWKLLCCTYTLFTLTKFSWH